MLALIHHATETEKGARQCLRCGRDLTPGAGQQAGVGPVTAWHSDAGAIVALAAGADPEAKPCGGSRDRTSADA
jgi:hypothetical protein